MEHIERFRNRSRQGALIAEGSDQDLKTGLNVAVQGEFNKSGEVVAHKIQVL